MVIMTFKLNNQILNPDLIRSQLCVLHHKRELNEDFNMQLQTSQWKISLICLQISRLQVIYIFNLCVTLYCHSR